LEPTSSIRDVYHLSKKLNLLARSTFSGQDIASLSEQTIDELIVSRIDLASFPRLWIDDLILRLELLVMVDAEANSSKKFELVDGCWAVIDNCRLVLKNPTSSICQSFEFTFDKIFNVHVEGRIITTLLEVSFKPSMLIGGISMWYDYANPDVYSFREFFDQVMVRKVTEGHAHIFNNYIKPLQNSLKRLTILARSLLNHFKSHGIAHLKVCQNLKEVYVATINLGLAAKKVHSGSTGGTEKHNLEMQLPKVPSEIPHSSKVPSVPSFSQTMLSLFQKLKISTVQGDLSTYAMLVTQIHSSFKDSVTEAEEEYFCAHNCKRFNSTQITRA
jgi:hypothetical protein